MFIKSSYTRLTTPQREIMKKYLPSKKKKKKIWFYGNLQADESSIKVQDSHKKGTTHMGYH